MTNKKHPIGDACQPDDAEPSQVDRFKQTARELGCDETGEAFERAFAKVAPPHKRKEAEPKDEFS